MKILCRYCGKMKFKQKQAVWADEWEKLSTLLTLLSKPKKRNQLCAGEHGNNPGTHLFLRVFLWNLLFRKAHAQLPRPVHLVE